MSNVIRDGLEKFLADYGDGWHVAHYVVAVGLERVCDGEIETASWLYTEPTQAEYITNGLLMKADELQHCQVVDEDD